ncbi:MAG TPA: protein-glutamine glutaminase family protein [Thermoanaerobaculia bacterium]|nr:protein-glutamine glutaminase family protein [Thermoanaerobaculia bacterium]
MPDPNAIVALVTRLEPSLDQASASDLLRQRPEGVVVELEGYEALRLAEGDGAAGRLDILEGLRRLRTPVYLEIDPATRRITRLLIPLVTRVSQVVEGQGAVSVVLEASHAHHQLSRERGDFAELLATLREAADKGSWLAVTENDAHEVIDVRLWPHEPFRPERVEVHLKPSWWRWLLCFFRRCCVTSSRAQELFDLCATKTCSPTTVPPPCIPFLYPDDGCWARAHEMCRLMELEGAQPRKVWIDGSLHTPTRNHPNCIVHWGWHVAPTLCVRRGFLRSQEMVIDPSLFTTPVSQATWKGAQGDPGATLTPSDATLYWRYVMPSDPGYVDTNIRLAYYRLQLQNRSLGANGPPPYAHCP